MKNRLITLALLIVLFIMSAFTRGTFAWFTDLNNYINTFEIGDIKYSCSNTFVSSTTNGIVVPGQPLIYGSAVYLTNQSNIQTNLRAKILFQYIEPVTLVQKNINFDASQNNELYNFMDISISNNWGYSSGDFSWYYTPNSGVLPVPVDVNVGDNLDFITDLSFNGDKITSEYSGVSFTVKLVFQAKQASFVDWETIGVVDLNSFSGV